MIMHARRNGRTKLNHIDMYIYVYMILYMHSYAYTYVLVYVHAYIYIYACMIARRTLPGEINS